MRIFAVKHYLSPRYSKACCAAMCTLKDLHKHYPHKEAVPSMVEGGNSRCVGAVERASEANWRFFRRRASAQPVRLSPSQGKPPPSLS